MKASYIDLLNRFWRENFRETFSPVEKALYLYLLAEANARHWEAPLELPTVVVCYLVGIGKNALTRAREVLAERGLITYEPGIRSTAAPRYTIVDINEGEGRKDLPKKEISPEKPAEKPAEKAPEAPALTSTQTPTKQIIPSTPKKAETTKDLAEIEREMRADRGWIGEVERLFPEIDVGERLTEFLGLLRLRGETRKTPADTRSHFINWLTKNKSKPYDTHRTLTNPDRRGTPPRRHSPEDYYAPLVPPDWGG